MVSKTTIAWLAGLVDGEGCIYGRRINNKTAVEIRVEIHSASRRMIDAVQTIYDELNIRYKREPPKMQPLSTRPAHRIVVGRKQQVFSLLKTLLPHLRVKDVEAQLVVDFVYSHLREKTTTRSTDIERHDFIDKLRSLKRLT